MAIMTRARSSTLAACFVALGFTAAQAHAAPPPPKTITVGTSR